MASSTPPKSYDILDDDIENDMIFSTSPTIQINPHSRPPSPEQKTKNPIYITEEPDIKDPSFNACSPFGNIPFFSDLNSAISSLENSDTDDNYVNHIEHHAITVAEKGAKTAALSPFSSFYSDDVDFNLNYDKINQYSSATAQPKYKKLSYHEIEKSLEHFYDKDNKYANELNILTTYVKGQKHVYMQSNYITEIKMYLLTFIAMALTGCATVLTPVYDNKIAIAILNAIATILISLMNYSDYQANARMYLFIANHYDIMENSLEMANNRMMFINDEQEKTRLVLEKMREVEFKITEIKNVGKILVPNEIGKLFPTIPYVNIFTFIKKMDSEKKSLIFQFRDVKNEIRYIMYKWKYELSSQQNKLREKTRLDYLLLLKEKIKTELISFKNKYEELDEKIVGEIKNADSRKFMIWCYMIYGCAFG